VPGALHGHPVAVQPRAEEDGVLDVFFCATPIAAIDLKEPLS
jgi:hypothetical protein